MAILRSKLAIPTTNPFMIQYGGHPSFGIVLVVDAQLMPVLIFEWSGTFILPNDKRWKFFTTICIHCQCKREAIFAPFYTRCLFVHSSSIGCHPAIIIHINSNFMSV